MLNVKVCQFCTFSDITTKTTKMAPPKFGDLGKQSKDVFGKVVPKKFWNLKLVVEGH